MKRFPLPSIKQAALALGLLVGGAALGQAFLNSDFPMIAQSKPADLSKEAGRILDRYQDRAAVAANAVQIGQLTSEAGLRLQYIQVQQNAEIIRLLGVIAAKK